MASPRNILFLQLPQIDNDVSGPNENLLLAAAYLQHAAEQAGEGRHFTFSQLSAADQTLSVPELAKLIADLAPDFIAATLYLWNVESTLRLIRLVKGQRPAMKAIAGGPETASSHPFLFRAAAFDAVAVGEGETVFPEILKAFRTGQMPDLSTVAVRHAGRYRWGSRTPSSVDLARALPPPDYPACGPNARGMAYLETSRGCPMRCTYCRYPHLRRTLSFLPPSDVEARVKALRQIGTSEIRFIDPTFNAHPQHRDILRRLARLNRSRSLKFFAELNADRLTGEDADLLAAANFVDIEVGMQSRDATVLREIRRPTDLERLETGVRRLTRRRIKVTLDIMYGLPRQHLADVKDSISWALRLRQVNIQCLQTLLLPGTELRDRRRAWKMISEPLPPYPVTATSSLTRAEFTRIEDMIAANPRLSSDLPTTRFVGRRLPDRFAEVIPLNIADLPFLNHPPGRAHRRALAITGQDLFGHRQDLAAFVSQSVRSEPDTLFQFVLCPACEEPLDLLDVLIAALRQSPSHLLDRYASAALSGRMAARRLLIQLPRRPVFAPGWIQDAEDLLASAFF